MQKLQFWKWNLGADTIIGRFDRGEMSKQEKFRHFFIVAFIIIATLEVSFWFAGEFAVEYSNIDKFNSLIYMLISIFGLVYLYRKHTDNTSFVEKYFVVLVASIIPILIVIILPFTVILYTVVGIVVTDPLPEAVTILDVCVNAIVQIIVFWKLGTYFK